MNTDNTLPFAFMPTKGVENTVAEGGNAFPNPEIPSDPLLESFVDLFTAQDSSQDTENSPEKDTLETNVMPQPSVQASKTPSVPSIAEDSLAMLSLEGQTKMPNLNTVETAPKDTHPIKHDINDLRTVSPDRPLPTAHKPPAFENSTIPATPAANILEPLSRLPSQATGTVRRPDTASGIVTPIKVAEISQDLDPAMPTSKQVQTPDPHLDTTLNTAPKILARHTTDIFASTFKQKLSPETPRSTPEPRIEPTLPIAKNTDQHATPVTPLASPDDSQSDKHMIPPNKVTGFKQPAQEISPLKQHDAPSDRPIITGNRIGTVNPQIDRSSFVSVSKPNPIAVTAKSSPPVPPPSPEVSSEAPIVRSSIATIPQRDAQSVAPAYVPQAAPELTQVSSQATPQDSPKLVSSKESPERLVLHEDNVKTGKTVTHTAQVIAPELSRQSPQPDTDVDAIPERVQSRAEVHLENKKHNPGPPAVQNTSMQNAGASEIAVTAQQGAFNLIANPSTDVTAPLQMSDISHTLATQTSAAPVAAQPVHMQLKSLALQHLRSSPLEQVSTSELEIRLDPPELGRLKITFSGLDGSLTAVVTAERGEVDALLRRHAQDLERMLSEAGFEGATLSFGTESETGTETGEQGDASQLSTLSELDEQVPTQPIASTNSSGNLDIRL